VFALEDSDSLAVFRGNGNRTLTRIGDTSLLDSPAAMTIGDLTGSAAPDLLVGYRDSTRYSVLPNLGGGVWRTHGLRRHGMRISACGDRRKSGARPDRECVRAKFIHRARRRPSARWVRSTREHSSAAFGSAISTTTEFWTSSVEGVASPRTPSAWKGLGGGAFGPRIDSAVRSTSPVSSLGDIDGDGNVDIAHTAIETPNLIYSLGNGDGTFGRSPSPPRLRERFARRASRFRWRRQGRQVMASSGQPVADRSSSRRGMATARSIRSSSPRPSEASPTTN
jgi:hypothetical protein